LRQETTLHYEKGQSTEAALRRLRAHHAQALLLVLPQLADWSRDPLLSSLPASGSFTAAAAAGLACTSAASWACSASASAASRWASSAAICCSRYLGILPLGIERQPPGPQPIT
ncbi:MAG: hypothetical protein ACKO8I_11550, partial [Cyanobacteriota bacterium]